jgi:hypothetical protein
MVFVGKQGAKSFGQWVISAEIEQLFNMFQVYFKAFLC